MFASTACDSMLSRNTLQHKKEKQRKSTYFFEASVQFGVWRTVAERTVEVLTMAELTVAVLTVAVLTVAVLTVAVLTVAELTVAELIGAGFSAAVLTA